MAVLVGTSGWTYESWAGRFYPADLPSRRRLEFYAEHFPTVELNASYYRWPPDASFEGWNRRLPAGFVFTVKAPRELTHGRRLYRPERWIEILARGLGRLGERRGPLLVQLPPDMARDDARLDHFLAAVPDWIRVAVEFRHPTWLHEEVFRLLERRRAAYVVMSGAHLPCELRVTTDFAYVRWHGSDQESLYTGSYSDTDLSWWADRIRRWQGAGHRVYGYFNNDLDGHAVANARTLRGLLGA